MEAREKCDFSSIESVNLWYPPYSNKGTFNCPLSLINKANTRKGKSLVVRDWRKLSLKQQREKWDDMLLTQQQKKKFLPRKPRQSSDVDITVVTQQPPRKKRRTLADDRNESEDEEAWERMMTSNDRAAQRRNKKNDKAREKTQQRNQQQQQQQPTIINGLLDGGKIAANTSAAAAARKVSQRRSINQPPTTSRQLNDKVVNKLISNTENACMKVAAATQPPTGVDLGDAFTATMVFTISNVPRSDRNGGCTNAPLRNGYKVKGVNPGAERAEDALFAVLLQRQRSRGRTLSDAQSISSSIDDTDIAILTNNTELMEYNERENSDRKRARTEEDSDINQTLGEDISNLILM